VEHQVVLYRRLCLALVVMLLLGVNLAAQGPATSSDVVSARHVEIVNNAGQVLWRAEAREAGGAVQMWDRDGTLSFTVLATPLGGRLEILNGAGQAIFTVGQTQTQDLPGHWERHVRVVDQQQQKIAQQQQELAQLGRRLSTIEQLDRSGTTLDRHIRNAEDMRRDLDQQRRELDQQRRLIDALERQVRTLERR
jgi:hypothetical protein